MSSCFSVGRRGLWCDAAHRTKGATPPQENRVAPQAGFFCAVAEARCLNDALHRPAKRAAPQRKIIPVKWVKLKQKDSKSWRTRIIMWANFP
ncbi:MAG: hypothetical protein COB49_05635 [Alphaproteobacteria bacterium]|nr:MAG: hypothetical protein COB49_05635 [Alphaproteobacteria bacterium]